MEIRQLQQYPLSSNKKRGLAIKSNFRDKVLYVHSIDGEDRVTCTGEYKTFYYTNSFLPVLYPLFCLTQEIEVYGERFVPMKRIKQYDRNIGYKKGHLYEIVGLEVNELESFLDYPYWIIQLLQSWFINYQGIESVNPFDLEVNPYK